MSADPKSAGGAAPAPAPMPASELLRIVASMTVTCALGAAILGGVYIATDRYAEEARVRRERSAVTELLGLSEDAKVMEIRQYLTPARDAVVYRLPGEGNAAGRELVFALDGTLAREGTLSAAAPEPRDLHSLGRIFVAMKEGAPAGFVAEGETKGYKNRIRFFVALKSDWSIAGVRVVEHEEDPGLGAEVATGWFQGQYVGRTIGAVPRLDVTRDPMPEDWRAALRARAGTDAGAWTSKYGPLAAREGDKPIYAVTGATISSRALTDGVRATILHFRRRWELLAPHVTGTTSPDASAAPAASIAPDASAAPAAPAGAP